MNDWLQRERRLAIFGALVVLQVLAVVGFIAREEYFLRTGTEILVQTRPVDPRDVFRGDFMTLSYEFEDLDTTVQGVPFCCRAGEDAYLWMREQGDYWEPFRVTRERPGRDELDEFDAVALRGRVESSGSRILSIGFKNIGQFYIPERTSAPDSPPDARLVVDGDGSARVRGLEVDGEPWP
jgi:hypothetical protein